jgi:hypothetical protein
MVFRIEQRTFLVQSEVKVKQVIAVILVLLSGTAYGQLLKCVDKSGRVEYASVCPAGARQEQTGIKNAPASTGSSSAPQKSLAERDAEFRKRQTEQQESQAKQDKKTAENQQTQRACDDARSYLKSLQAGNRIARTDPTTGERVFLEDKEYAGETANAQRMVDTNCK